MKTIFGAIVLFAIIGGGYYWYASHVPVDNENGTAITGETQRLTGDAYPLYAGATWGTPQSDSVSVGTTSMSGLRVTSVMVDAGMDPASVFSPFEKYYDEKLKAAGWEVANDLAAGGHTGGQTGYRKDGAIILTGFRIVYHTTPADAPSECPCDVTLSLFSGR